MIREDGFDSGGAWRCVVRGCMMHDACRRNVVVLWQWWCMAVQGACVMIG